MFHKNKNTIKVLLEKYTLHFSNALVNRIHHTDKQIASVPPQSSNHNGLKSIIKQHLLMLKNKSNAS